MNIHPISQRDLEKRILMDQELKDQVVCASFALLTRILEF
jgi:hypothetical protein